MPPCAAPPRLRAKELHSASRRTTLPASSPAPCPRFRTRAPCPRATNRCGRPGEWGAAPKARHSVPRGHHPTSAKTTREDPAGRLWWSGGISARPGLMIAAAHHRTTHTSSPATLPHFLCPPHPSTPQTTAVASPPSKDRRRPRRKRPRMLRMPSACPVVGSASSARRPRHAPTAGWRSSLALASPCAPPLPLLCHPYCLLGREKERSPPGMLARPPPALLRPHPPTVFTVKEERRDPHVRSRCLSVAAPQPAAAPRPARGDGSRASTGCRVLHSSASLSPAQAAAIRTLQCAAGPATLNRDPLTRGNGPARAVHGRVGGVKRGVEDLQRRRRPRVRQAARLTSNAASTWWTSISRDPAASAALEASAASSRMKET